MFALSKIFTAIILSPIIFLLMIAVLFVLWRKSHKAFLIVLGVLFCSFYLFSIVPIRNLLSYPLESRYALRIPLIKEADVLVLGGGVQEKTLRGEPELATGTLLRVVRGYQLYRKTQGRIIVSGGTVFGGTPEALVMSNFLISLGVPTKDIIVEPKSRNTYENIARIKSLLGKDVYVVTSAYHLPRTMLVLRKAKLKAIPVGCDYLTASNGNWTDLLPAASTLNGSFTALKEYIGIGYYWLRYRV